MNSQAVRQYVMALYPNATWHQKVHNMPDKQVYAIYRAKEESRKYLKDNGIRLYQGSDNERFHQIDIWEYLNDKGGTHQ